MNIDELDRMYFSVMAFEKGVRSSLGAKFSTIVSAAKHEEFASKLMDLIGEDSNEAKLSYICLVNDVLAEIEKSFPIKDLHAMWPSDGATKDEVLFLSKHNCISLARVADEASSRRARRRFHPNKFQF